MKSTILFFFIAATFLRAGEMEDGKHVASPSGAYYFQKLSGKSADIALWKAKPSPLPLKGARLEGDTPRPVYYRPVWSADESILAIIWSTFKRQGICLYRIHSDTLVQLKMPDYDGPTLKQDLNAASQKGIHEMSPDTTSVKSVKFVRPDLVEVEVVNHYIRREGAQNSDNRTHYVSSGHSFKFQLKKDTAVIADSKMKLESD